jgi:chlorobactene glucosyltransferase
LLRGSNTHKPGISANEMRVAALLESGSALAYRLWLDKGLDVPWYYALTHPLAGTLFEGILAQSAWRILTHKGVDWRGRQYYNGARVSTSDEPQEVSIE